MKKTLLWMLLVAFVLSVVTFLAPHLIARGIEMGLYRTLGADVSVRLASYPSLRLLLGQFEQIEIEAKNVSLGGLVANQYALVAENVAVNMRELLMKREVRFRNEGQMQVRVVVEEGELSKLLWERIPELRGWRIQLHAGRVTVLGQVPLLNAKVDIAVQGKFVAVGQDKIAFVPEGVEILGAPLPAALVNAVMQDTQFHIDLAAAPMPLELLDVKMEPGQLIVVARVLR
ncbi:MAG: DUF2993 domain-containing protein [Firmicutes bacterium]|nr:DUF2993 domain-containing protein [Dethiobacter sp.]MBS3888144.1 DUF2993 domain-containing protein [Bacillota bacterium]